jgi:hypothetical protein
MIARAVVDNVPRAFSSASRSTTLVARQRDPREVVLAPQRVARCIRRDAIEPGPYISDIPQISAMGVGFEKRILRQVRGQIAIAGHPVKKIGDRFLVLLKKFLKGLYCQRFVHRALISHRMGFLATDEETAWPPGSPPRQAR